MRRFTLSLVPQLMLIFFLLAPGSWAAEAKPQYPPAQVVSATVAYEAPSTSAASPVRAGKPKNIILFIGDGMGPTHVAAGRAATAGFAGTSHMDRLPVRGLLTTHPADAPVTDSAASATAIASGQKTLNGAIGVTPDDKPVETIRSWAESLGKSTGIITTDRVTGATPAAFYAHATKRGLTQEIAAQLPKSDVDICVGGGWKIFAQETEGARLADVAEREGFLVVQTIEALTAGIDSASRILALLADDALPQAVDRPYRLADLVKLALGKLSTDEDGFFLMVEGAQIDWTSHDNDAQGMVNEWADFDTAVGEALQFVEAREDTLVLVTADHETGGLTLPYVRGTAPEGETGTTAATPVVSLGIAFSSGSHTGSMVPLFAAGTGASEFAGARDNTQLAPVIRSFWNGR